MRSYDSPLGFSEKAGKALNFPWHMEWRFELFYLLIEGRGNARSWRALGEYLLYAEKPERSVSTQ